MGGGGEKKVPSWGGGHTFFWINPYMCYTEFGKQIFVKKKRKAVAL